MCLRIVSIVPSECSPPPTTSANRYWATLWSITARATKAERQGTGTESERWSSDWGGRGCGLSSHGQDVLKPLDQRTDGTLRYPRIGWVSGKIRVGIEHPIKQFDQRSLRNSKGSVHDPVLLSDSLSR